MCAYSEHPARFGGGNREIVGPIAGDFRRVLDRYIVTKKPIAFPENDRLFGVITLLREWVFLSVFLKERTQDLGP
jgi:hypothetical protein